MAHSIHDHPIHDHLCRCHRCKPSDNLPRHSTVVPRHQPVPPAVRQAMHRILCALLLLISVLALCLEWWSAR